jgi:hypothetical protein
MRVFPRPAAAADLPFAQQLYFETMRWITEVMQMIMAAAKRDGRPVTLAVVKFNPAVELYKRLGFRITSEDQHKFYMEWPAQRRA